MENPSPKHFYLFKGDWYDRFIELIDIIRIEQQQRFVIWEPLDKHKEHNLIVVYGAPLSDEFCFIRRIWKTNEHIFDAFYRHQIDQFNLHSSYNPVANVEGSSVLILENQISLN